MCTSNPFNCFNQNQIKLPGKKSLSHIAFGFGDKLITVDDPLPSIIIKH